jgi:formate hydrogenlyase subunit 4
VNPDLYIISSKLLRILLNWAVFVTILFLLPPLLLGVIRKTKAKFQGRIGARFQQPLFDLIKMLRKGETISQVTSWLFRSTSVINLAVILIIALCTPWLSFKPQVFEHRVEIFRTQPQAPAIERASQGTGAEANSAFQAAQNGKSPVLGLAPLVISAPLVGQQLPSPAGRPITSASYLDLGSTGSDIFLIIYLFALARLFTVLAALDAGSVFGGFGASREVTLALLVEPGIMLAFASLGCAAHTSDLNAIFSFGPHNPIGDLSPLWFIAGLALFLATLVELSRMPVDDPTTHLELTMVHEAMILENSGRNLALTEYTHLLKMTVLFGLTGQCFLHGIDSFCHFNRISLAVLSIASLVFLAFAVGFIESASVKLRWNKVPEFVAYSVLMSLLCIFIAIGVRR